MHEWDPLGPICKTMGFGSSNKGMLHALTKSGEITSVSALLSNRANAFMPAILTSAVSVWWISALLLDGYIPACQEILNLESNMGGAFSGLSGVQSCW